MRDPVRGIGCRAGGRVLRQAQDEGGGGRKAEVGALGYNSDPAMLERIAFEGLLLFLAPFGLFAIYLLLRARYPLAVEHWTGVRVSWLTLGGVALALGGLLLLEVLAPRGKGVYIPAHMENGNLIPGRFQ